MNRRKAARLRALAQKLERNAVSWPELRDFLILWTCFAAAMVETGDL